MSGVSSWFIWMSDSITPGVEWRLDTLWMQPVKEILPKPSGRRHLRFQKVPNNFQPLSREDRLNLTFKNQVICKFWLLHLSVCSLIDGAPCFGLVRLLLFSAEATGRRWNSPNTNVLTHIQTCSNALFFFSSAMGPRDKPLYLTWSPKTSRCQSPESLPTSRHRCSVLSTSFPFFFSLWFFLTDFWKSQRPLQQHHLFAKHLDGPEARGTCLVFSFFFLQFLVNFPFFVGFFFFFSRRGQGGEL